MKSLTKDKFLATFKSEAKADPDGKQGEVRSISEKLYPGVGSSLAWMPNGSLIMSHETAKLKQQKTKKRIIMWEKNGLRHGEFDIFGPTHETTDEESTEISDMKWNTNSKVLSVQLKESNEEFILFFVRNNYKWYLKSKLRLQARPVFSQWSSKRKYEYFCVFPNGECLTLSFKYEFTIGQYSTDHKTYDALATVVDGNTLLCTPLSKYVTAPPMAHFSIKLPGVISDISFSLNKILVVIMGFTKGEDAKSTLEYTFREVLYHFDTGALASPIRSVSLICEDFVRLSFFNNKENVFSFVSGSHQVFIHSLDVNSENSHKKQAILPDAVPTCTWVSSSGSNIYCATQQEYNLPVEPHRILKLIEWADQKGQIQKLILSESQQLYWNDELILENCISLTTNKQFMLCTSMTQGLFDQLHIHPLTDLARAKNSLSRLPSTSTGKDHRLRNVERGSDIISLSDQRLVFELPRGNLETIYPKLLVFHEIKRLIIEEKAFYSAYKEIRRHKLDLNLVTDVSPKTFSEEVSNGRFLSSFTKTDDINLILNSLEKDLAPDLIYIYSAEELAEKKSESESLLKNEVGGSKVNYVCHLLREAMIKEQDHYILSIVMTYTRQQPPALEKALELVTSLQKDEDELCDVVTAPHLNPNTMKRERVKKNRLSSKEVLEYLSWVADAETLYSVALGTFDLKLAVIVAETTQRDPKEYLPYVEALRAITDPLDRSFKICLDTKQFDRAVGLLAQGSQHQVERALAIVKEKKLFAEGIRAFKNKPELSRVREMLADELVAKKDYKQAAHYYLANGNLDRALDCCEKTLDWEAALEILSLPQHQATREQFLNKMKEEYINRKNYSEAAKILRETKAYTKSEYVSLLIDQTDEYRTLKKLYFDPASPEDQTLIKTIVLPKLDLGAEILLTNFTTKIQEFIQRKARLDTVQQMKRENTFIPLGGDIRASKFDNVSEMSYGSKATGGISLVTGASGAQGKKMKKPRNLKYRNIQENSPFEEEYLVEKLNEAKIEENEVKDAFNLIDCMLMFGQSEKCKQMLELMDR